MTKCNVMKRTLTHLAKNAHLLPNDPRLPGLHENSCTNQYGYHLVIGCHISEIVQYHKGLWEG